MLVIEKVVAQILFLEHFIDGYNFVFFFLIF